MQNGRLKALGTPSQLKNRYAGYKLTLTLPSISTQHSLVEDYIPMSTLDSCSKNSSLDESFYTFSIPPNCENLPSLLTHLDEHRLPFSITQTSLEQVFFNVCEDVE